MSKRKIISNIFIVCGALLITVAAVLACMNEYENRRSMQESADIVTVLQSNYTQINEAMPTETPTIDSESDETPDKELTEGQEGAYQEDTVLKEMPEVNLDGYNYIGYLHFHTTDAKFPIMSEWDYPRLKIAPCRYYGSIYTNDLVIAGHNYRNGFGVISSLREGDYVTFYGMDGQTYVYCVGLTEVLKATDVTQMIESNWDLTLYTCTYGGKERVTVRLRQVSMTD